MAIWWQGMNTFQQTIFVIAVSATIVMLIFLVLMLFGLGDSFDGDVDIDVDLDGDAFNSEPLTAFSGLRIFTIRGSLAFLSVGGWVTLILSNTTTPLISGIVGVVAGGVAMYLLALAFKALTKLESEGNLDYHNAIGKTGNVYIKIPKNKSGIGKVIVTLQERLTEVDAITNDAEDLKTGTTVEIIDVANESTVIVRKKL